MYKVIFSSIVQAQDILEITDSSIDNNSIIDVYSDNEGLYAAGISVEDHTLTISFDGTLSGGNIAVIVNNIEGELPIPTKTSQLQNDSGYITENDIPTIPSKTSQLENDSGYITASQIPATSLDFSTTEHKMGKWIDGNDYYAITYSKSGSLSSGFNSFFTLPNIEKMIGSYLSVKDSSNNYYYSGSSSNSNYAVGAELHIDSSNVGSFGVRTNTSWSNPTVWVTYLYTKVAEVE